MLARPEPRESADRKWISSRLPELLLVEDTRDDELMSLKGIADSGVPCRITVQRDGVDALNHLQSGIDPLPAWVVLDYKLPKLNGAEILAQLKSDARTRHIPVVIFSGSNDRDELAECYRSGANSVVVKPSDGVEYVNLVAWITRYWLTLNLT